MKREKKTEASTPSERRTLREEEKAIEEFADIFLESMKEQFHNNLEPLEVYAQKVRSHIHSNEHEFKIRLAQGYEILLNEISQDHPKK